MTPRLEACYFEAGTHREFSRLARVLAFTAELHCADWQRAIVRCTPGPTPKTGTGVSSHIANTQKLAVWCARIREAVDGQPLLLIDADTVIVRPLDDIWAQPFDLAYTVKTHLFPFNLGVMFFRVSDRVRAFADAWLRANDRAFAPDAEARAWRRQYGGVNQTAFGLLRERGGLEGLRVRELGCAEWNCEESAWATFDPAVTRILHVKGTLRGGVFMRQVIPPALKPLVQYWRDLERTASRVTQTA